MKKLNLAVLASGSGSNLQAIINSIEKKKLSARIVCVISNNSDSGALKIARKNKIPPIHLSHLQFKTEYEFEQVFISTLQKFGVDLVVLAGYMKRLSPTIVRSYKNSIINIHPGILPFLGGKGMYGINVHRAVIDSGMKITAVSIHFVDEIYDHGPIIAQKPLSVLDEDTAESLQKRVLRVEHQLYPKVLQLFAEGRVSVKDGKVYIKK